MTTNIIIACLAALLALRSMNAYTIEGYIQAHQAVQGNFADTEIFLNGSTESLDKKAESLPQRVAKADKKGYFFFDDVASGNYKLTISSLEYVYPSYVVEASEGVRAFEVDSEQRLKTPVDLPLRVSPKSGYKYFDVKQPFDLNSFMRSPYGIMIAVTVGLLLCMKNMPKLEELQAADRAQQNN